jgi:hypothetical protein
MLMDYDVMLFYIYVLIDAINELHMSVHETWNISDADGINGPPWTPCLVREWIVLL